MEYAPLINPNYLDVIYKTNGAAAGAEMRIPNEAFARLKPSYVAQPFLVLQEPSGNTTARPGPFTAIANAHAQSLGRSPSPHPALATAPTSTDTSVVNAACIAMSAGELPWLATSRAVQNLYTSAGCEPCELVLSCGDRCLGKRAKRGAGGGFTAMQTPAVQNDDATGFDVGFASPRQYEAQTGVTNNWMLSQLTRYAREWETNRQTVQYGTPVTCTVPSASRSATVGHIVHCERPRHNAIADLYAAQGK